MKKTITWILIADGARARVFKNEGPGKGVQSALDRDFSSENLASRDLVSDNPGRTFDSAGSGRHAKVPHSDPRRNAKHEFARELAKFLDQENTKNSYDRLIIVAPPQALGDLRSELTEATRKKLSGEINKDLTHLPIGEIADHLGSVLAV